MKWTSKDEKVEILKLRCEGDGDIFNPSLAYFLIASKCKVNVVVNCLN